MSIFFHVFRDFSAFPKTFNWLHIGKCKVSWKSRRDKMFISIETTEIFGIYFRFSSELSWFKRGSLEKLVKIENSKHISVEFFLTRRFLEKKLRYRKNSKNTTFVRLPAWFWIYRVNFSSFFFFFTISVSFWIFRYFNCLDKYDV